MPGKEREVGAGRAGLTSPGLGSAGGGSGTGVPQRFRPTFVPTPDDVPNYIADGQVFCFGKGATYGSWISEGARSNGYVAGGLIQCPASIIEYIARESGLTTADIDTDSFDVACNTTDGLLKDWEFAGVIDNQLDWTRAVKTIAAFSKSYVYFSRAGKLTIKVNDKNRGFSVSGTGIPADRDIFKHAPTVTNERFQQHPIIEGDIQVIRDDLDEIVNEIRVNYFKDYNSDNYLKQTFITSTDSDDNDTTREAAALNSINLFNVTQTQTVDCPFIIKDATARLLRNFLFDSLISPRYRLVFRTWVNGVTKGLGDIINVQHPLLDDFFTNSTTKKWIIYKWDFDISDRTIKIECVEMPA